MSEQQSAQLKGEPGLPQDVVTEGRVRDLVRAHADEFAQAQQGASLQKVEDMLAEHKRNVHQRRQEVMDLAQTPPQTLPQAQPEPQPPKSPSPPMETQMPAPIQTSSQAQLTQEEKAELVQHSRKGLASEQQLQELLRQHKEQQSKELQEHKEQQVRELEVQMKALLAKQSSETKVREPTAAPAFKGGQ